jgi:hypothetical protein
MMRNLAIVGWTLAVLISGCVAPGVSPAKRSPAPGASTSRPTATPNASKPESGTPASGSDSDWDKQLNEAFGPMDPAFVIRGPEPLPTQAPGASSPATP